jgi:hypothetical protein
VSANGEARIDADSAVLHVAEQLGIRGSKGLRAAICNEAERRVETWLHDFDITPERLEDVQALVLNQTRLEIRRVADDDQLRDALEAARKVQPALPKQLEFEFAQDTEAVVIRRPSTDRRAASRYLAIVDARGDRRVRAWFAERHESSHLVLPNPQAAKLWRRTRENKAEPLEQVVDAVAARVGFWTPIVRPVVRAQVRQRATALDALESARLELAPDASREAAYRSFVEHVDVPLLLARVGVSARRNDASGESLALRVQAVVRNTLADRASLGLWLNYRIPSDSIIARAFAAPEVGALIEDDDLGRWETSSGRRLRAMAVRITASGPWAAIELR